MVNNSNEWTILFQSTRSAAFFSMLIWIKSLSEKSFSIDRHHTDTETYRDTHIHANCKFVIDTDENDNGAEID